MISHKYKSIFQNITLKYSILNKDLQRMAISLAHRDILKEFLLNHEFKEKPQLHIYEERDNEVVMKIYQLELTTPDQSKSIIIEGTTIENWNHCQVVTKGDFSEIPIHPYPKRWKAWRENYNPDPSSMTFKDYFDMVRDDLYVERWKRLGVDIKVYISTEFPSYHPIMDD
jgi:hypothetical protein